MFKKKFHGPWRVTSHLRHRPIGLCTCFKHAEMKETTVSVLLGGIYKVGNVCGAMAIILLHLWCFLEGLRWHRVKKGQIKTILPPFSLTVHTVLFTRSRFVSTVRFSIFSRFSVDKTCYLLANVCLRSCHRLSSPALSMTACASIKRWKTCSLTCFLFTTRF